MVQKFILKKDVAAIVLTVSGGSGPYTSDSRPYFRYGPTTFDIQEELLFLPRTVTGRDPICEKDLRPITLVPYWQRQRKMWAKLASKGLK
jgi:hypothetical protein